MKESAVVSLPLARVEQDDGDVPGLAVDVLQERRGPEERVERARATDEDERAVGAVGVLLGEALR